MLKDKNGKVFEVGDVIKDDMSIQFRKIKDDIYTFRDPGYRKILAIDSQNILCTRDVSTPAEAEAETVLGVIRGQIAISFYNWEIVQKQFLGEDKDGKKVYKGDILCNNNGIVAEVFQHIPSKKSNGQDCFLVEKKSNGVGGWVCFNKCSAALVKLKYPKKDVVEIDYTYKLNGVVQKDKKLSIEAARDAGILE